MDNSLLFELGTEEIPANMITPGLEQLRDAWLRVFHDCGIGVGSVLCFSTPRRLALLFRGLPEREAEREEVLQGPPVSVALDGNGQPTAAAHGFARKLGVAVEALERVRTDRGEYLALRRKVAGRPVPEVVTASAHSVVSSLSWPKNMVWSESRFRFIRPLRWFVCLWNDRIVPFEIEGVASGRTSRGHRFLGHTAVEIPSAEDYVACLQRNFVLVDPAVRRARIEEGLQARTGAYRLHPDPELLDQVVHLNEFPSVVRGNFDPVYLRIPAEVLVTVMRHHQKYFSLVEADGRLAPCFLTVINNSSDPEGRIRRGHEKVLQARLEDAAFFWDTDRKTPLRNRVERLGNVLFQEKLGSYLDKTRRIQALCRRLDPSPDLQQAAELCKADLVTDMVREFSELQGVMGGLYAREEGYPEPVWRAIYEHYQPVSVEDPLPPSRYGKLLSIADRIDTIVGCFSVGIVPSGSSDPFALRRQAQGLVALLGACELDIPLPELVSAAQAGFPPQPDSETVREQVLSFLQQRVSFQLQREAVPPDVIRAVLATVMGTVPDVLARGKALAALKGDPDLEALAVAYKRSKNILQQGGDRKQPDPQLFQEDAETALFQAFQTLGPRVQEAVARRDYEDALRQMAAIRGPVDRFFDEVLVMTDEEAIRENRLALLRGISDLFLSVADISEIVQPQGGGANAG